MQSLIHNMSSTAVNPQFREQHLYLLNQYQDLIRNDVFEMVTLSDFGR